MSRENNKPIAVSLATATCALLGTTVTSPVNAQEEPAWEFNTALLYYGEGDDRVEDISLNVLAQRNFVDDRILTLGLTVDSLTGATPIGAMPFNGPQTFTTPSGLQVLTRPANEIPLDDTFLDTRYAISGSWQQPFGRMNTWSAGLSFSGEYDYTHIGANFKLSHDFNNRNLLLQVNYSFSDASGYLNDPYKIVSLVDSFTGDPLLRTPTPGVDGPSHQYLFESRPDERTEHSLYAQSKYYMDGKVLDASYRFMTDDWDIDSHTVDLRYRWPLNDRTYLEPHVRYYTQSHAEFYQPSIDGGATLPSYASADYRLGEFDAITVGVKYGWETVSGSEWSARLEYYMADGSIPGNLLIGTQGEREIYPDLDAVIAQISYRFGI